MGAPGHEAIQDIDWKEAPPLGGYVATTLKGTAEMVLMTHQEDPLLATWRYGLGRSVAFTSDAKAKWGVLWLRWGGFNKFWSQVTRWTLRTRHAERHRGHGRAHATTWARWWWTPSIPRASSSTSSTPRSASCRRTSTRTVVELEQVARAATAAASPPRRRAYTSSGMAQRRGEQMVGSQLAGLVVPYSQEFRDLGVDETLLRELSELTGGGAVGQPRDAFLQARRKSRLTSTCGPGWSARGGDADPGDRAQTRRSGLLRRG